MLIKSPFVEVLSVPLIIPTALDKYAERKNLDVEDDTPFSRIYWNVMDINNDGDILAEFAGRSCYQSWTKGRDSKEYVDNILESRHGSVLQHANYTLIIAGVSRSLTHELVRHHAGTAPSQLSQRFFNENNANFVVPPALLDSNDETLLASFKKMCVRSISDYEELQKELKHLTKKQRNEAARAVLTNAIETEIVFTGNLRAWRNIIEQRGNVHADREIRRLAVEITKKLKTFAPLSLNDLEVFIDEDGHESVSVKHSKV